ncbi:MAG: hypothetical protein ABIX28_03680 [Vicinamibacterales bacterium]
MRLFAASVATLAWALTSSSVSGWSDPLSLELRRSAGALAKADHRPESTVAAELDWQIITGATTGIIAGQVRRWAADGYRVQAIVADAPGPTVVVAREGRVFRRTPAVAEYRVLDADDGAQVTALGAEGFRVRAAGRGRSGPALVIFERELASRREPRDYRSLQAPPAGEVGPLLATASDEGYAVAAALGDSGSEWLILERRPGGPRDTRVLSAPDVEALETSINQLASEGFACDAAWNRPPKGLGLFKPGTLMAAVSRRRGATTPAAHVAIDQGREPSESGRLIAVVPYRNSFAFVVARAGERDYAVKAVTIPADAAKDSWLEDRFLERLRGQWWDPIDAAWAITSANTVTAWVGLERRAPIARSSSPGLTRREAAAIVIPAGAVALPRGGGKPGETYRAHLAAIARGDIPGAKALWTGAQRSAWDKRVQTFKAPLGMGFSEKDLFSSLRDDLPTDPVILGGWLAGEDRARIRIEATHEGVRSVSDVDLAREAGLWKISEQQRWQAVGDAADKDQPAKK